MMEDMLDKIALTNFVITLTFIFIIITNEKPVNGFIINTLVVTTMPYPIYALFYIWY